MGEWMATLKLLHVVSASVLFGTRLGGAWYLWRAERGGDAGAIASVARNVLLAELLFTTPAAIVQPLTGIALARALGLPLATPWLAWSLGLFIAVGAAWLPLLWLEYRIAAVARECHAHGRDLPPSFGRSVRAWHALEWPVFAAVLVLFGLMVFRPGGA